MKFIIAVIKPSQLDDVHASLMELGISGITVSEVRGYGRQRGQTEIYRGTEYNVAFVPKVKLEIACGNDVADDVVETIRRHANTDKIGDGKIFVVDLKDVVRIRTNEMGTDALT